MSIWDQKSKKLFGNQGRANLQNVLIVEDNTDIAEHLVDLITKAGWSPLLAENVSEAKKIINSDIDFALALVDVYLPGGSGVEVIKDISSQRHGIGILAVSGLSAQEMRQKCFDNGADDFVSKPFNSLEILSRMQAILRRLQASHSMALGVHQIGTQVYNPARGQLEDSLGNLTRLTRLECDLLNALVRADGGIVSRKELLETVWKQPDGIETRTVDVYISRLRKILSAGSDSDKAIDSVRGKGYRLASHQRIS